jgi:UDP-GlcNAc:undecaprenyl-phosphate GlcNAc-1-phosphate transferase
MSVIILYVVSGALGLVSIALVDKGLLPSIILLIVLFMFGIGGARNLKEVKMLPEDKRIRQKDAIEDAGLESAQLEAASGDKSHDRPSNESPGNSSVLNEEKPDTEGKEND